ncbi:hypothetical protein PF005_g32890, partial [Phytophthora fragariae]
VRRWSPGVVRGSVVQEGVVREEGMEDVRLDKVREDVQINKVLKPKLVGLATALAWTTVARLVRQALLQGVREGVAH